MLSIDIRVIVDNGSDEPRDDGSPPPPNEAECIKALETLLPGTTLVHSKGGAVVESIEVIGYA